MHSKARIGGTQILVKHAMIQVYVYFKILLTCIFLLFILWYTMLKVSLHAEDYYLVIENDNPNFADIFFFCLYYLFPFFVRCWTAATSKPGSLKYWPKRITKSTNMQKNVDIQERATRKASVPPQQYKWTSMQYL